MVSSVLTQTKTKPDACESTTAIAALRGHYAGYDPMYETYGIISSADVYMAEDDNPEVAGDEFKTGDAEDL